MKTHKVRYSKLFTGYCFQRDERTVEGTIPELNEFFGYTLLLGHQENARIPLRPRTIKSLVNALNDSARVTGRNNISYWIV